jgi:hypothetical protein
MSTPEQAPGAIRFSPENVVRLLAELRDRDSCDFDRVEWCEAAADLIEQLQADVVRLTGEQAELAALRAENDTLRQNVDALHRDMRCTCDDCRAMRKMDAEVHEAHVQAFRAGRSSRFLARGWTFEKTWTGQDRRAEAAYLASLEAKEPTP